MLALLALDLGVFNRRPHAVRFREAAAWSAFWVALSLAFNLGIYWRYGAEAALQFFTSYLLEKSLSADNIFLFAVIFTSMGVAAEYQHRVLFWGVLGALVMRGAFIVAGVQLVRHFHAVLYFFGALPARHGSALTARAGEEIRSHQQPGDSPGPQVISNFRRIMREAVSLRGATAGSAPPRSFWF